MTQLIGFYSSVPRSGKSTAAQVLAQRGWAVMPFASTLKRMMEIPLRDAGMSPADIAAALGSRKQEPCAALGGATPRQAMQWLGTEWGRRLNPDLWVNIWKDRVRNWNGPVCCDDMRFPNELTALRSMGGIAVRIVREVKVAAEVTAHASEGGLEDQHFDVTILNTGSLVQFQEQVLTLIQEVA